MTFFRRLIFLFLLLICYRALYAAPAAPCDLTHTIPSNQWVQISLPCDPGASNTVSDVFGDDGLGSYGTDWVLWRYNPYSNDYEQLQLSDTLNPTKGYWMMQTSGSDKTLQLPDSSEPIQGNNSGLEPPECIDGANHSICRGVELASAFGEPLLWNMAGYPNIFAQPLGDLYVTDFGNDCDLEAVGQTCDLDAAEAALVVHNEFFTFVNGSAYDVITPTGELNPWKGYWVASLENSSELPLLWVPLVAPH